MMKMVFENEAMQSNLETFMICTTPVAPRQILSKSETRSLNRLWHPSERESVEYFSLADIWNSYDEWSAYGAGVPIGLTSGETVVQYYVPYLSAIQIFTSNLSVNNFREETESGDVETRDSFSESSSSEESENERSSWRWDGSSSDESGFGFGQENQCHLNDRLGHLYFQFFERSTPYGRIPLMDKINGLARRYPGLMSLRSVDLSPASWMSVAWYPIYHIPMGKPIKDLSTCFLTYHTLSSSFQDAEDEFDDFEKRREEKIGKGIGLFPFGLATHKMQGGGVWGSSNGGGRDLERVGSLLKVADSWLKQLRVQHHDFDYFIGMRRHGGF